MWKRLPALLLATLAGCGEIELEEPQRSWPPRLCEEWEVFDPESGQCLMPPCVFDEDCLEGERCDRIEGVCKR